MSLLNVLESHTAEHTVERIIEILTDFNIDI
jgi:hypothetical protein